MNTLKILEEIGITKREIAVYVALLRIGSTTTGPLVKESGVPNSKIYEVLEKLMKRGMVNHVIKSKTKYFQPSQPQSLFHYIEEKKHELGKAVKELENMQKPQEQQYAYIYESVRGVKTAFDNAIDYLKPGEEICVFSMGPELGTDELRRFWDNHFLKRQQKGIKGMAIAHISLNKIFTKYYRKYKNFEFRFTELKLPTGVFIYRDHVLTFLWGDKPTAYVIKSKQNYEAHKRFFEDMWNLGK